MFDIVHFLAETLIIIIRRLQNYRPLGYEVDDQSMSTVKFKNGALGYVGSCWTSPGIFSTRVFAQKGLMHFELDFSTWDDPDKIHESSKIYIQRGKDGYGLREDLDMPAGNMFRDELEIFGDACRTGISEQLTAHDGNVAVAMVYAVLKSVEEGSKASLLIK